MTCLPTAAARAENRIEHVLLISVDGLHALDVARYVRTHPDSAFAELAGHGVTYTNARTPAHSDSFPGLLALMTGGSPITTGIFYDVSYDRTIFAPTDVTCSNPPGFSMVFDESIDRYDDHHISLDVIDPDAELQLTVIKTPVVSSQVAPTILRALGLNPNALRFVRVENTRELPGLERGDGDSQ